MRRFDLLGWLLLPMFLGCSGRNVVAGEEKTKPERLAASVPSWCQTTCSRFTACSAQKPCDCTDDVCDCFGVDDGCPTQCQASFAPFTNAGEACAVIGERIKKCIDRATCDDLGENNPCPLTDAERAACPDPNRPSEDVPTDVGSSYGYAGSANGGSSGPNGYGGTVSYAGSANIPMAGYGGNGGFPATNPAAGPPVTCQAGYGEGGGQPSDGSSQVICEEGRDNCSNASHYSWVCLVDSQGRHACTCLRDAQVTGAFAPTAACPPLSEVNARCGWNLAE